MFIRLVNADDLVFLVNVKHITMVRHIPNNVNTGNRSVVDINDSEETSISCIHTPAEVADKIRNADCYVEQYYT